MHTFVLLLPLLLGTPDDDARAALALAAASVKHPIIEPPVVEPQAPAPLTYAEASALARNTQRPLVVFVGVPLRDVAGCVTCGIDEFYDGGKIVFSTTSAVIVSADTKNGIWMSATATDKQILDWINQGVNRPASPFLDPRSIPRRTSVGPRPAEDEGYAVGPRIQFPRKEERRVSWGDVPLGFDGVV